MRYVVVVMVGIVALPLILVGGAVAITAMLGEWLNFQFFDFSNISILDWLAGGPGAGANSFENYISAMIGFFAAAGGFLLAKSAWSWAQEGHAPGRSS